MRIVYFCVLLLACGDPAPTEGTSPPICDGKKQADEADVDAPFDADGDGYVDGNNPDCAAVYDARVLDCDDTNADIHPGADEIRCSGVDEDCNEVTVDRVDADDDGVDECEDCDDSNPLRAPGNEEICENGIDDDCDGEELLECPIDFSGTYTLTDSLNFVCLGGEHTIDVTEWTVIHNQAFLTVNSFTSSFGALDGTVDSDNGDATGQVVTGASCVGTYNLVGEFDGIGGFTGSFDVTYNGLCNLPFFQNCTAQSFTFESTLQN